MQPWEPIAQVDTSKGALTTPQPPSFVHPSRNCAARRWVPCKIGHCSTCCSQHLRKRPQPRTLHRGTVTFVRTLVGPGGACSNAAANCLSSARAAFLQTLIRERLSILSQRTGTLLTRVHINRHLAAHGHLVIHEVTGRTEAVMTEKEVGRGYAKIAMSLFMLLNHNKQFSGL